MRRRDAIVLVGVLVVVAAAAAFVVPRLFRRPRVDVDTLVARLDSELAAGSLDAARGELATLRTLPRREDDLLRILRRALSLSSAGGDWAALQPLAARALALQPGSASIRATVAYADLRAGRLSDAERVLSRGRLPADLGGLLRGEALLRRGQPWPGSDALTRDIVALRASTDPAAYASAALRAGDERLSLDAALLAMEKGSVERARSIVLERLGDTRFDDVASSILYDVGDGEGALLRLESLRAARGDSARASLFSADILRALGRPGDEEAALLRAVSLDPGLSWTAYSNLAYDAAGRGDDALADQRLADGLVRFPGSRDLLLARARILARRGDPGSAVAVLQPLLKEEPGNVDATLLSLDLLSSSLSPEARRARLWKLYNLNPADPRAFASLMESLMGVQDWQGAAIAIGQREAAGGAPDADLLLMKGTVAAMQGDSAQAVTIFQTAASVRPDGKARFDMALVQLSTGNTRGAVESLDTAALEYERKGDPAVRASFTSHVLEARGEAMMLDGKTAEARTALTRALAMDAGNLRAALLLRKLEAAGP